MRQSPTIFVELCEVIKHQRFVGQQYIITLKTKKIAKQMQPGQFVHLRCCDELLMRRPISIMACDDKQNTIDLLYKVVGEGTQKLSQRQVGEQIDVMGPIGTPFHLDAQYKRPILIGGGVGMPPMIALAQTIKNNNNYQPLVILGSEVGFPFNKVDSQITHWPQETQAMDLLETWRVSSQLCSLNGEAGTFKGYVSDLAALQLKKLSPTERAQVILFACGPEVMLKAVVALAKEYQLPCQISLEEFMACAVGGCAGCTTLVTTPNGQAMKRVCVDGPVFDGHQVFV